MEAVKVPPTAQKTMELINNSQANQIPEMELVRTKYVQNYNACNSGGNGEFMYQRNLVFLQKILNSSDSFKKCSPFSVYECLTTIAAYGWSCDPADDHIYLIPRDGRLCISRQAGARLQRLYKTKQVVQNEVATLIYEGDVFSKKNGLIEHEEKYLSDKIIGGYVKFTLNDKGLQRHISYKMSDIEGWRMKSQQPVGPNWRSFKYNEEDKLVPSGQPHAGFLRKKIMLHACSEGCWIPGNANEAGEVFNTVIIEDTEDAEVEEISSTTNEPAAEQQAAPEATTSPAPANGAAPSFLKKKAEDKPF